MFFKISVLLGMIYMHLFDDYALQGILAKMKCKSFWKDSGDLYKNDFKMALIEHALSWTISTFIPVWIYMVISNDYNTPLMITLLFVNWAIHAITDDLKANKLLINLVTDQCVHFVQIIVTWIIVVF